MPVTPISSPPADVPADPALFVVRNIGVFEDRLEDEHVHRPWNESAELIGRVGEVSIWLTVGDIATAEVGAVVNAANDHGWMGSGVAGAIKAAGGREIEAEAMRSAPRRPGTAWATGGGRLAAGHVIHAAAMGQDLTADRGSVDAATRAAVAVARELAVASIAVPALGTGVGGFPLGEAAEVMGRALADEVGADAGSLTDVVFVLYGPSAAAEFGVALRDELATGSGGAPR